MKNFLVVQLDNSGIVVICIVSFFAGIVVVGILLELLLSFIRKKRGKANKPVQDEGLNEAVGTTSDDLQNSETVTVERNTKKEDTGNRIIRVFCILIVKLALCAGIVLFALVNYRTFSFDKGWSIVTVNVNKPESAPQVVASLTSIQKVEYYKNNFSAGYKVFISDAHHNYLLAASEDDIDAIKALSILSKNKPKQITPVPFYVEIIVGIIILAIPFGGRKKRQVVIDENS